MLIVILKLFKFIGLFILGLVCLLLALLLLVLVVPVRYKAVGEAGNKNGLSLKANVSYLFHIISIWVIYEKKLNLKIKIFGITFRLDKKKKTQNYKKDKSDKVFDGKIHPDSSNIIDKKNQSDNVNITDENKQSDNSYLTDENNQSDSASLSEGNIQISSAYECEGINNSDKDNNLKNEEEKAEKSESSFDKLSSYFDLLTSDEFKAAFSTVKYRFGKLLRSVLPKKGRLYLKFGSGDAGLIGKLFGYYEALYPFIGHVITFIPVFTDKQFEADINIKGRILPGVCLYHLIRIYLDKNCRRIINMFIKKK